MRDVTKRVNAAGYLFCRWNFLSQNRKNIAVPGDSTGAKHAGGFKLLEDSPVTGAAQGGVFPEVGKRLALVAFGFVEAEDYSPQVLGGDD